MQLDKAQAFAEQLMDSMVLMPLLPTCETYDGEERCYETTLITTQAGDSIQFDEQPMMAKVAIDHSRFGTALPIQNSEHQQLLSALFSGDEKQQISFCYLPRHAVAIYGPDRELTGFVELCFECSESVTVLQGLAISPLSQSALNQIGQLFVQYGFEASGSRP